MPATQWTPPGKMRHQIFLQEDRGTAQTASGQHVDDWQTYATSWASVEPVTGRDFWNGQQVAEVVCSHVIKMYYRPNVKPQDRVIHKGRVFNVAYAHDLEEQQRELTLYCREDKKAVYVDVILDENNIPIPDESVNSDPLQVG